MEDAVASLTKSLALVPPAAVPAIVDCVIASSCFEPSLLFSSLVRTIPDPAEVPKPISESWSTLSFFSLIDYNIFFYSPLMQVFESNCILSHAVALGHLIKLTRKL